MVASLDEKMLSLNEAIIKAKKEQGIEKEKISQILDLSETELKEETLSLLGKLAEGY